MASLKAELNEANLALHEVLMFILSHLPTESLERNSFGHHSDSIHETILKVSRPKLLLFNMVMLYVLLGFKIDCSHGRAVAD